MRARLSIRKRLHQAVQELPSELRTRALADIDVIDPEGTLDIESLADLIRDPSVPTERRATAAWVAGQIRERSLAPLLEGTVTSDESPRIVWEVAKSLCSMGRGLGVFRRLLRSSESPAVRKIAAYALGRLGDSSAAADLCACLDNKEEYPAVRGQAAEALGYLRTESSLSSLAPCVSVVVASNGSRSVPPFRPRPQRPGVLATAGGPGGGSRRA